MIPVQGPVCGVLHTAAALAEAYKVPLVLQVDNSTMEARIGVFNVLAVCSVIVNETVTQCRAAISVQSDALMCKCYCNGSSRGVYWEDNTKRLAAAAAGAAPAGWRDAAGAAAAAAAAGIGWVDPAEAHGKVRERPGSSLALAREDGLASPPAKQPQRLVAGVERVPEAHGDPSPSSSKQYGLSSHSSPGELQDAGAAGAGMESDIVKVWQHLLTAETVETQRQ